MASTASRILDLDDFPMSRLALHYLGSGGRSFPLCSTYFFILRCKVTSYYVLRSYYTVSDFTQNMVIFALILATKLTGQF